MSSAKPAKLPGAFSSSKPFTISLGVKSSPTGGVLVNGKKRLHSQLGEDSDSEVEGREQRPQLVTSFDRSAGGAISVHAEEKPKAPLVITSQKNRNWRVEKLTGGQVFGIAVGIFGVIAIIGPWRYTAFTDDLAGQLACLLAATCYGFTYGYVRRFLSDRPIPGAMFAFLNIGIAGAIMLVLTPVIAWRPVELTPTVVLAALALGVLGTGVAYIWNINVLRAWGATAASTVTYVTPVVGVALGVLVLQEALSWNEPVGALIVIVGILFTQRRITLKAWQRHHRPSSSPPSG